MESNDTKKSNQNTDRYLVTYTQKGDNEFAPRERFTIIVSGDLGEWFEMMGRDCIVELAVVIW